MLNVKKFKTCYVSKSKFANCKSNTVTTKYAIVCAIGLTIPYQEKKKRKKKGRNRTLLFYTEEVSTLIKDMPGRVEDVVFVC